MADAPDAPRVRASELADAAGAAVVGDGSVVVRDVTRDSAEVREGSLFCCIVGARFDGHDFAAAAVDAGAVALLTERELPLPVTQLLVPDSRAAMGPLAAELWGHPSGTRHQPGLAVVGVTGTNGKTTTVALIAHVLERLGVRCGMIGTLTGERTTPDATELQALLRGFADDGHDAVAMEVSSHALDLHRVDGTWFRVAVFTNLGVDHLDFHGTPERYFDAKARLFDPRFTDTAVVNIDDVHGRLLRDAATVDVVGYSLDDVGGLEMSSSGSTFAWRGHDVRLPLAGRFNVSNALAAAEAVRALGHDAAAIAAALSDAVAPPGRFETIDEGQPFAVVVDYAHTPDALANLLATGRELAAPDGRLRVAFGCGGDRDRTKRPEMGRIASELADDVVVTSDNPRSEDPAAIIAAVTAGATAPVRTEIDRRVAIASVLAAAAPGDVVVIAGKGHETTQTIGDDVEPFDDRAVARAWLRGRSGSA